jgi:hypothetical protein
MAHRLFHKVRQQYATPEMWGANQVTSPSLVTLILSCFVAATLLFLAPVAQAQTSMVIGTIRNHNGTPAVNVLVTIGTQFRYTDVSGRYKIDGVGQGMQHMTVKRGQRVLLQQDVAISGASVTVDQVLP